MIMNRELVVRLSSYKSVLYKLKSLGFVRVFSDNLADAAGVTAALVRKDFSLAGMTGHKRGGYQIDQLLERLEAVLGKNDIQRIIMVGCGKIGTALANYNGFARENIKVVAGFDVRPASELTAFPVPVFPIDDIPAFVRREKIKVAILAVPENAAMPCLTALKQAGLRGVLNFAPVQLRGDETCVIQNINIALEIENLFCYIRFAGKKEQHV
jgi:redox-sensing transcriptional repressor